MKAQKVGIFASIIASICCIGPLLLLAIGLGSLGIGVIIRRFHWFFLIAGVIVIIFAWSLYFREKRKCNTNSCKMENKKAIKLTLIIATIVVAFFIGLNLYTYAGKSSNLGSSSNIAGLETVAIKVDGMTCFTCEFTVSSTLKKINGVADAIASAKDGDTKVTYDPSKTNINELIDAINKTGYKASMMK